MIEGTETISSGYFTDDIFNIQESLESSELVLLPREELDLAAELLNVVNFNPTASGFTIDFNQPINNSVFELDNIDPSEADLMVKDASGNLVKGSIVFNDDFSGLTFVKTGDILEPGNYEVTLKSGTEGIIDTDGDLLDGNNDGTAGDDYTIEFTIDNPERVLSLSDLVLSPGQTLEAEQLSISINDGAAITNVALDIEYDSSLLEIDRIELVDDLPEGWSIQTDFPSSGIARITLTGDTALASGEQNLITIVGNVPQTATYGASQTLKLSNIVLNDDGISSQGDTAIHQVALPGDVSGDQIYSSRDVYLIAQFNTGLIDNFAAYPYLEPSVIVDLNGDGTVSAFDAYLVDFVPPTITINLTEDTGISNQDNITLNPVIAGNFFDNRVISSLEAGFNGNLTDITDLIQPDGSFTLSETRLAQLNGEDTLSDGSYSLNLIGTDTAGNTSETLTFSFTLDTQSPEISNISNPASRNDPNLTSILESVLNDGDKITGTADGTGSNIAQATYRFNDNPPITLPVSENGAFDLELDLTAVKNSFSTLEVTVTDQAGNSNSSRLEVIVPLTTDSGLQYADFLVGTGASPSTGDMVTVDYTGFLEDRTIFDSSIQRNTPFEFTLGVGQVIQGWDEGVASMNVGTRRLLIIPPELGYGAGGIPGTIPPNAILIFDVELLSIG